jgi:hypothetical protein
MGARNHAQLYLSWFRIRLRTVKDVWSSLAPINQQSKLSHWLLQEFWKGLYSSESRIAKPPKNTSLQGLMIVALMVGLCSSNWTYPKSVNNQKWFNRCNQFTRPFGSFLKISLQLRKPALAMSLYFQSTWRKPPRQIKIGVTPHDKALPLPLKIIPKCRQRNASTGGSVNIPPILYCEQIDHESRQRNASTSASVNVPPILHWK